MFITINLPLRTAFSASFKFWYVVFPFFFVSRYLYSPLIASLIPWLFRIVLFNFHRFVDFLVIDFQFLTWSEKILDTFQVFLEEHIHTHLNAYLRLCFWKNGLRQMSPRFVSGLSEPTYIYLNTQMLDEWLTAIGKQRRIKPTLRE